MSRLNRLSFLLALAVLPLSAQAAKTEGKAPVAAISDTKNPALGKEEGKKPRKKAPASEAPKKTEVVVSVFVKDADGAPVEDVIVTVDDKEAMILTRGQTDGSGNARLVVIHGGDAWVRIMKPGRSPAQKQILIAPTTEPIEVTLVMKPVKP